MTIITGVPQLTTETIIKPEEAKAKGKITPGDALSEIPDLDSTLIKKIQAANSEKERLEVLEDLLTYLDKKGIVDSKSRIVIEYDPKKIKSYGTTQKKEQDNVNSDIVLTIYPYAFNSPATLYNTIRHELIHVGQNLRLPDEKEPPETDAYFYCERVDSKLPNSITKKLDTNLQSPLQEIEAYAWELQNKQSTGIKKEHEIETCRDLVSCIGTLAKTTKGKSPLSDPEFKRWEKYIQRAINILNSLKGLVHESKQQAFDVGLKDLEKHFSTRQKILENMKREAETDSSPTSSKKQKTAQGL